MRAHPLRRALRILASLAGVAAITAFDFKIAHVNSATAAFSFLILILGLAARAGLQESIAASLGSVFAYNFFFLPPVGKLTIADPENWVALCAFLVTAITASQLSASARRKAEEAGARQQELERTYEFSRALILGNSEKSLAGQITHHISELFGVPYVAFYDSATESVCSIGGPESPLEESVLRGVTNAGEIWHKPDEHAVVVPLRLGGRCLGSLGIAGASALSEVAFQSIAQLVSIAIERARAQEIANRAEAARQNEQLKSILLDALAHEFKTPLTSIKAATTTVLSRRKLADLETELMTVVDEETDRLISLVSDSIELARIGAGPVVLQREPDDAQRLISSALAQVRGFSEGRELQVRIATDLPLVNIDRKLVELVLRQLLNNALKYSPPGSPIQIAGERQSDFVLICVSNTGSGISVSEQRSIFEKFYRGQQVRSSIPGTGMGLTIARDIIEAHSGRIWVNSEPGNGARFSFTLPTLASRSYANKDLSTTKNDRKNTRR